jgi:hypothetical protein
MLRLLIAIVAVSVLAPLAFVPIGASAQSMSVLPTFSPATIQMPRTMYQPSYGYQPTYSYPSVKWACRAEGRASQWGKAWNFPSRPQAIQRALAECGRGCRIVSCTASN